MSDLIKRIEAAERGSWGLSWEVAQHLGWTQYWAAYTIYLPPGEIEDDPRIDDDPEWRSGATTELPGFTTVVDDAMTLIPEHLRGGRFFLEKLPLDSGPMWSCTLREHAKDGVASDWCYSAPLAVCAAALRACALSSAKRTA